MWVPSLVSLQAMAENNTFADIDLASATERQELTNDNFNEEINPFFGANVGYGIVFPHAIYTGLEFFVDSRKQDSEGRFLLVQQDTIGVDFSLNNTVTLEEQGLDYGFRLRPGYIIDDRFIVNAVVGYVRTQFKVSSTTLYNNRATSDAGLADLSKVESDSGIQLGAGVEYRCSGSFSVRAEYYYTAYDTISVEGAASIVGAQVGDNIENKTNVTPKYQTVLMGVNYYFT